MGLIVTRPIQDPLAVNSLRTDYLSILCNEFFVCWKVTKNAFYQAETIIFVLSCVVFRVRFGLNVGILGTQSLKYVQVKGITNWSL